MLIGHITDLHIRGEDDAQGRKNVARLAHVLEALIAAAPDLVIATGDLADHGDIGSYRRLQPMLARLPMPVHLAPGNHDCRAAMRAAFPDLPMIDGEVRHVVDVGGRRIILLDTLLEGRHGGYCSQGQADWLAGQLAAAPTVPTLIAMHHPPVESGIAWMDAQSSPGWADPLARAVAGHDQILGYVCGHLHRAMTAQFAGRPLFVAPSSAPQVMLDLLPLRQSQVAGRPMIVEEAPGYALHLWTDAWLVSHAASAGPVPVLARHRGNVEQEDMGKMDWMAERQHG